MKWKLKVCLLTILWLTASMMCSCRKYLDLGPSPMQLTGESIFGNDATATAAQLAIFSQMESDGIAYSMIVYTGICGDECTNYLASADCIEFATNQISTGNPVVYALWSAFYKYIYQANAVLEGLAGSTSITPVVRRRLTGEALFTRAFCHFYLLHLFGNIPFIGGTDYRINSVAVQRPKEWIMRAIIDDLLRSKDMLDAVYVDATNAVTRERVRPNRYAAEALLARIYLYDGQWTAAEEEANAVIHSGGYSLNADLSRVFLKNNPEAIWQWMAVLPGLNSYAGALLPVVGHPAITLSPAMISAFETGDKRRAAWTLTFNSGLGTYVYPYKFKVTQSNDSVSEYSMVLRLAEQYLIRAEARAKQNKWSDCRSDLDFIRRRAGLPSTRAVDSELIDAISVERRVEFFAEFGDRWFDMKRTDRADSLLSLVKGNAWSSDDQLFPLPQQEIDRNSHLKQNPGY